MKRTLTILFLLSALITNAQPEPRLVSFDFFGEKIEFEASLNLLPTWNSDLSIANIQRFYEQANAAQLDKAIEALKNYKLNQKPDDWLFYQLIRKLSQQISPKNADYTRYTLYKWYFMVKCGYDAFLTYSGDRILFYVQCDENIYNIPARTKEGKQYVCLNYHDYGTIDFTTASFKEVPFERQGVVNPFSYRVRQLPQFRPEQYAEKKLTFTYENQEYLFKVKINKDVQSIFANYPVLDYNFSFNIPMSSETYSSLIPLLRKNIKGLNVKGGVDYLMKFTRYAFGYETDSDQFGKEKRLTPEETILYNQSDCEDRAALFFYLVKEIYDLPMIVLSYPTHVTVAVQFKKAAGKPIIYKGNKYYVCEPTPQATDLRIGEQVPSLANVAYDIAYVYTPRVK